VKSEEFAAALQLLTKKRGIIWSFQKKALLLHPLTTKIGA
jgi:hypothetical protein